MTTLGNVFEIAVNLIDETNEDAQAFFIDSEEFMHRTPPIMRTLIAEYKLLTGARGYVPEPDNEGDALVGIDDVYALGVLPYGLAAKLVMNEDSRIAAFLHERYEELRERYIIKTPVEGSSEIEDVYGGGCWPHNGFGRW